jgi:hypothetical protein
MSHPQGFNPDGLFPLAIAFVDGTLEKVSLVMSITP